MSGLSCQGRFLWMEVFFFFLTFPLCFCEWKTTGKSSIKARSLPGHDWLLRRKLRPRLLGARLPGFWLAHSGNRDFIHKSVYSSGQRQEIRALERGNPPITNLDWPEQEKQVSQFSPNHVCNRNDSTAGAQKSPHSTYKLVQTHSNCVCYFSVETRFGFVAVTRLKHNICFPSQFRRWTVS